METLELTQEELELIRERRKTYDVEKVNAEEVILESITKEIEKHRKSIFKAVQECRRDLKVNKKLVEDLNKEAGEELFKLGVWYSEEVKEVVRHYYTDENGVRSAISYKSNYSENDQKYGPREVEWRRKYKVIKSRVEHVEFSSVYLTRDTYTEREGQYYNIHGLGYDVERRSLKRLSSIVTRVKDLVHINREDLEKRVFFNQCEELFKTEMETVYLPHEDVERGTVYDRSAYFTLKNGIEINVNLQVDYTNKTYSSKVQKIIYPELKYSDNIDLQTAIQGCRDWKSLPLID